MQMSTPNTLEGRQFLAQAWRCSLVLQASSSQHFQLALSYPCLLWSRTVCLRWVL